MEWENNLYICRMKELGLTQNEGMISSLCGWMEVMTGTAYITHLTLVTGTDGRTDMGVLLPLKVIG